MKILNGDKNSEKQLFCDINKGDEFEYKNVLYMKIEELDNKRLNIKVNAVRLLDGETYDFSSRTLVSYVNAYGITKINSEEEK